VTLSSDSSVLLIGPVPPPVTGQAIAFSLLVEELKKARSIVTADLSEPLGRRDQQFSLARSIQILRLAKSVIGLIPNASAVYLTIAQSRLGFLRDALFIAISCLWQRPVIAHLHGGNYASFYNSESPAMRYLIRKMLRKVKRLIVLSDRLRHDFDFLGSDFEPRLRTVKNASNLPRGRPRKAPSGKLRLLYLSNLVVEKGYMDCVYAVAHLRRLLPDVSIKLVLAGTFILGDDQYRTTTEMNTVLRENIRSLDLEDAIEFSGTVLGEEKVRLLETADIHLLPTYYRNEGQPITLIEALAAGLPSVTTRWRDIEDIIADSSAGIFVPPKNPLAVAQAIADLYNDPDGYERMSKAALLASKQFSPALHVAEINQLIDEVSQSGLF